MTISSTTVMAAGVSATKQGIWSSAQGHARALRGVAESQLYKGVVTPSVSKGQDVAKVNLKVSGMPKVETVEGTVSKRANPSSSLAWWYQIKRLSLPLGARQDRVLVKDQRGRHIHGHARPLAQVRLLAEKLAEVRGCFPRVVLLVQLLQPARPAPPVGSIVPPGVRAAFPPLRRGGRPPVASLKSQV